MPESDAAINALDGKRVTITIAEKSTGASSSADSTTEATSEDTFTIDNGKKILTITIAE